MKNKFCNLKQVNMEKRLIQSYRLRWFFLVARLGGIPLSYILYSYGIISQILLLIILGCIIFFGLLIETPWEFKKKNKLKEC